MIKQERVPAVIPCLEAKQSQHDEPGDKGQEDTEVDGLKHGWWWEGLKRRDAPPVKANASRIGA
jgi:hypothetical protein